MLFSTNPYRVLGVSSDSGIKDIQKNISKLKAFAKIGKEMELDYNLPFLNLAKIERTDDLLLKSENQLNLDKNKITSSLFWFADLSPIDAVALAHLIKANISKAIEIWDKATTSKEVSLKNYSAFNNLSCWNFKRLVIALKFLFKISISLSAFNSGTLVFKFPIPISFEADIKLLIEIKNLDENLIAIVIDKNNNSVTIIMYINAKENLIPRLLSSTL